MPPDPPTYQRLGSFRESALVTHYSLLPNPYLITTNGGCQTSRFEDGSRSCSPNSGTGNSPGASLSRCRGRPSPVSCCSSIFFCKVIKAWMSASGRGGQPGICTSTGMYRSIPFSTLYPCLNGPPEMAQAPIAMTYLGS